MTRVGFVGLGLMGARRLLIASSLGCEVAFAVDPDPARADAGEIAKERRVGTIADIRPVDLDHVDAVFVAVPHDRAFAISQWAIERGIHVLCEKPLGVSSAEAGALETAAQAAGLRLCAGFNYRYLAGVLSLRTLLRGGALGRVHRARMFIGHGGRPGMEAEWKMQRRHAGGGALIDPGIHLVDLARHLFGEITDVACWTSTRFWKSDVEDNCSLDLRAGDTQIDIDVSLTSWKSQFRIEVLGSDGMAVVSGRGGSYGPQSVEFINRWFWNGDDRRRKEELGLEDDSFALETRAFLGAIRDNAADETLSTAKDGRVALEVVETAYAAVARERP